eukprot:GEMP01029030.1.p1 GENE.GEMP01029030.1~~GEMP01029030.1.p1  ORF type:complete len:506 (+),score=96.95 GEMP01029030.1:144-1661(+)
MLCLQWLVFWLSWKATYAIERTHWRLVCKSGTTNWGLCSVDYYSDVDCAYSLIFSLVETSFSEPATEYSNLCATNCNAHEGYVGFQFIDPVNVLCLKLNTNCPGLVSCDTMSLQHSSIGMLWEEYATFPQSTTLNVCDANPSVDSCSAPAASPSPTPAPTPGSQKSSVTLIKSELLVWDASKAEWISLNNDAAVNSERPVSVRLQFSAQVYPLFGADAYLQITKGVRAPHVDSLPIPSGKVDVKKFPAQTLDAGSTYVFYILTDELLDALDKPLPRIFFTFATEAGPIVTESPHQLQEDSREPEIPFALIGGVSAVAVITLAVAAYVLWDRHRYRLSYRVSVAPHYAIPLDHENPQEAAFVDAGRWHENGTTREQRASADSRTSAPGQDRRKQFSKDDFSAGRPGMGNQFSSDAHRKKFQKKRSSSFSYQRDLPQPVLSEGDQVARITAELAKDFQRKKGDPIEARKKDFKFLLLRWHPDKNADSKELATKIFQYIQEQKDWYLS